jgi:hypothetical protein
MGRKNVVAVKNLNIHVQLSAEDADRSRSHLDPLAGFEVITYGGF